ncbi:unnamed protein product, partial [Chrysoparadoxa australica]
DAVAVVQSAGADALLQGLGREPLSAVLLLLEAASNEYELGLVLRLLVATVRGHPQGLREMESGHLLLVLAHLLRRKALVDSSLGLEAAATLLKLIGEWENAPLLLNLDAAGTFLLSLEVWKACPPVLLRASLAHLREALTVRDLVQQGFNRMQLHHSRACRSLL